MILALSLLMSSIVFYIAEFNGKEPKKIRVPTPAIWDLSSTWKILISKELVSRG